jgi:hypothetical protein
MSTWIPPFTAAEKARAASLYLATKNGDRAFRKCANVRRGGFREESRALQLVAISPHKNQGNRVSVAPKNQLSSAGKKSRKIKSFFRGPFWPAVSIGNRCDMIYLFSMPKRLFAAVIKPRAKPPRRME